MPTMRSFPSRPVLTPIGYDHEKWLGYFDAIAEKQAE